ncbi:putative uncharacterized protein IGF2BP2-AS1 [Nomascus leucogenys]|uniref:putative uncharacterized protein IGF2BP2-AS1 n=1 Tax=Nomascus leucogenys TaxID=61853 RepID=UPI00122D8CF5|nr:putative uncharacterized protein IGF2BP2-AS1 [Nomascus leucogenys]
MATPLDNCLRPFPDPMVKVTETKKISEVSSYASANNKKNSFLGSGLLYPVALLRCQDCWEGHHTHVLSKEFTSYFSSGAGREAQHQPSAVLGSLIWLRRVYLLRAMVVHGGSQLCQR